MAIPLAKITIVIGAGLVGTALVKEGRISNVSDFFSGALKIATKSLHQDKNTSSSTSKTKTDSLLVQVNNLRQELQLLASSRSKSVTILTTGGSGSSTYGVTAVIVVGVVGYGYIWWKGWKLSDMMFATRRGLSDACMKVGKQLDNVSSSISVAKQHLSSRIDRVDCNIDECMELTAGTKDEVSKLHGELSGFEVEVETVHRAVQTLESKLGRIEGSQNLTTRGVYHLCDLVRGLEQSRNAEYIQASPSYSSRPALEPPETTATRTVSLPPLALEPSSPAAVIETLKGTSSETPKVLRTSTAVSASGLKELQEMSNAFKVGSSRPSSMRTNTTDVSNGTPSAQESTSSNSGSGVFRWKLPSIGLLTRSRSTAS